MNVDNLLIFSSNLPKISSPQINKTIVPINTDFAILSENTKLELLLDSNNISEIIFRNNEIDKILFKINKSNVFNVALSA